MIDKMLPIDYEISKKIHGHVRVETKDRWTGRVVDSQEKENLVTNALAMQLKLSAWGVYNTGVNSMLSLALTPFYYKALGGLLLFNGTLTESADNIWFPSNVKLVGCAGQGSNSSDAIMGSLNTQESVHTSTGFTTTWDFLTSQANGTIASLARTYQGFPGAPWREPLCNFAIGLPSDTITSGISYLGYDDSNHYLYIGLTTAQIINGITYPTNVIYRATIDFTNVSLTKSFMPPASKLTVVKTLSSSDGDQIAWHWTYDVYDNNFFKADGSTLHLIAMDGTHSTKTFPAGTSGTDVKATESYYWRKQYNTLYLIQKSNMQLAHTFSSTKDGPSCPLENDIYTISPTNQVGPVMQYFHADGTVMEIPTNAWLQRGMIKLGPFLTCNEQYDSDKTMIAANYLGTIANLNSPVTKTSSQTMKITYTLSEA